MKHTEAAPPPRPPPDASRHGARRRLRRLAPPGSAAEPLAGPRGVRSPLAVLCGDQRTLPSARAGSNRRVIHGAPRHRHPRRRVIALRDGRGAHGDFPRHRRRGPRRPGGVRMVIPGGSRCLGQGSRCEVWHGMGRGPGRPFGPDPSRRRRARSSVVYWVSGPFPGPTPHPAGVPRLDGPTALRLAERSEPCPVMPQNPTMSVDGQPAVPCWTVQQITDLSSDVNRVPISGNTKFSQVDKET